MAEARPSHVTAVGPAELGATPDYMHIARGLSEEELSGLLRNLNLEQVRDLRLQAEEQFGRIAAVAFEEIDRRDRVAKLINEGPPTFPIALPQEFSWLAEDPDLAHDALQREPIDPAWSPDAEAELYKYFSEHPEIATTYGAPIINCRTTGCEIAFVTYGIDNSERARQPNAMTESGYTFLGFNSATSGFSDRPWVAEHVTSSPASVHTRDGATTILWHLFRKAEE